jgi:3-deoxy-D-arabino-heptulosonate 7-phosphate (DAHP) synthase
LSPSFGVKLFSAAAAAAAAGANVIAVHVTNTAGRTVNKAAQHITQAAASAA